MVSRPYAQRLNALRAAKGPACGCGHETHDHGAPKVKPTAPVKATSVPSGYKSVGAIDSRGA